MAKSIAKYVEEGVETPQTQQGLDIMAERARGEEEGEKPEGRASFEMKSMSSVKMPTRPGQQAAVTMDMVKAAGFDNLRDYLNDQKGLTRRGDKPAEKSYENKVKFDPAAYSTFPLEVSREATRRQQKEADIGKKIKYAKGGKINLDACGVSTHTPSKKTHPNW